MFVELEEVITWIDENIGNYSDYFELNFEEFYADMRYAFEEK